MFKRLLLAVVLWPSLALSQTHVCTSPHVSPQVVRASLKGVFEIGGKRFNVDPDLAQAITQVESGFDPRAISPKGAQGLMQLMPGTSAAMHVADPLNPHQSIYGGMQYLHMLANDKRFANNPYMVLVAYNAGPNHDVFPEESYRYADTVLAIYHALKTERLRQGGLIRPTRSLNATYLSIAQCGRASSSRPLVLNGQVMPSRRYR